MQGQRSDVPGTDAVIAAELVMLSAVEQGADAQLPGDTVHSTLVFANQGLAYRYRRDTVAVYANVVRATHGADPQRGARQRQRRAGRCRPSC